MTVKKDSKGRNLKQNEDQMKDGRYRYRYTDRHGNRNAVYSWKLVPTDKTPAGKREDISLREKEKQIEKDLDDGIVTYEANVTVEELIARYLATKVKLADTTLENYRNMLQRTIKGSRFGKLRICNVRKSDVKLYYKCLHEECDFAVGTIQLYQNLIFPAFQMAVDDDLIRKNPCVGCMKDYPRGSLGSNKEPLTVEEQNELLRFAQNSVIYEKYYVLLAFLLSTGLRISEAIGITWDDIHLDEGYVEVNHQIIYRKIDGESKHRVHLPKNGCSRVVPMQPEIMRLLKKYKKATYWTSRLCEFEVEGLHNFVFLNKELRLYTPNTLTRAFHELTEAQNREMDGEENAVLLPQFTAHVLRHTYCTRMAENGCDIKVLQEIMGHKNIKVTMQVYNHSSEARALKEVQRIGSVIAV